jgi:RNA polymerase sigma-70 factor (ECF subfamily)
VASSVTLLVEPDIFPAMGSPHETDSEREQRFDELYRTYFARVLAYALRRAPQEVAHDVVADTFLVAWRRLERLPDEPLPWLLAVARKTLANARRGDRRRNLLLGELEARDPTRHSQVGSSEPALELGEITVALGKLLEPDRELLQLVAWEGLTVVEAARVLGQSAATCRVRLHRARRRLVRELGREAAPEPFITIPKEQL